MSRYKTILIFAAASVAGCYSTLTKPGMTPESKATDRYQCEKETLDSHAHGALEKNGMYRDCMRARGYQ